MVLIFTGCHSLVQAESSLQNVILALKYLHHILPQGIDPDLKPITDPSAYPVVVHGTYSKAWEQIRKQGLSKMRRNHIHFAQA